MMPTKPITIVGGGLAGLSLGIGLRQRHVPVKIFEAGHYPRHRVCGEFISGRGLEVLNRLGLRERFMEAGARVARTAAFFSTSAGSAPRELPMPALCLSRYAMDELLANEFRRAGGELAEGVRWKERPNGESVVHASGRRVQSVENGWRWFGLKVHARGVRLDADLEMHVSGAGYVGLCRLNGGAVNICGLFRRRAGHDESLRSGFALLRGESGAILHQRLATAEFDESSFCSVAGLSLRPQRALDKNECCIGDALTMIPPVTGNGMSMAFESAEMAIAPLTAFSKGELSVIQAQHAIARRCDEAFARRLAWAWLLQWLMFALAPKADPDGGALGSNWLWRFMFAHTR